VTLYVYLHLLGPKRPVFFRGGFDFDLVEALHGTKGDEVDRTIKFCKTFKGVATAMDGE
jgi:hypothetical protein